MAWTRAVVLEISPEVVEASRFFEAENHRALQNPAHSPGGRATAAPTSCSATSNTT